MATPLAELLIKLGVDDSELDKLDSGVSSKLSSFGGSLSRVGGNLTRNLTLPLAGAGVGLFALAGEAEEAQAKLSSSFESMGASAFTSMDKLNAHAEALQSATTFDDEGIANFQSVLLTFGNVTGDTFSKATELGLDMSAKLGTDLQSSALQVGKALNDPAKGLAMLNRVGIQFTDQQKEQIKSMQESGDMAGAQAIILGELERQFGGTAEAMAQTNTGQAKQAMNALANAGESIAMVVAPAFGKLAQMVKGAAEWFQNLPEPAKNLILILAGVAAAVGPVLMVAGKAIQAFGAVGKAFGILSKLLMANPWMLLIAATIALVVLIVQNWDKIKEFLGAAWDWIKRTAGMVWDFLKDIFRKGIEFLVNLFMNWTLPGLIMKHWDKIKEGAKAVVDFVKEKFNAVVDFFGGLPGRIGDAVAGMWDGIKSAFRSAVNWIIKKWNDLEISIGGGKILGVDIPKITIRTPNIPTFHEGGIFRAPIPGGEGLALLKDREQVVPGDQPLVVHVFLDGREIHQSMRRIERGLAT